ncbi:hypothetical protein KFL_010130060 [Klebsormidium nitens]|uniref:Uncharacterized protein n=1 Tax=Klebsormidium nitens TaxID=105231 RepID=A0A1Y1INH3_KLENI|nr:hypothetical protein KFL_010130060 [Klebsormidium nitens]|eukprot:GAQ92440.1 hypothetical protein KFL_010130060 [Klebsormidium nitens]
MSSSVYCPTLHTSYGSVAPLSPFGEKVGVHKTNIFNLKPSYGLSVIRDDTYTTGNGTVTGTLGQPEFVLTAPASSSASLVSAERGRYIAGFSAEVGIGVRVPQALTGTQTFQWGYTDSSFQNGFYFQISASGLSANIVRNGVVSSIPASSFNCDRLDGTGPSGQILDMTKGNIWHIVYSWYGYGAVNFQLVCTDTFGNQFVQSLHRWAPSGQTSTMFPNLNISTLLNNTGSGTINAYVAGRQYSIYGEESTTHRVTSGYNQVTVTSATWKPIVSFRRKTGWTHCGVRLISYDAFANQDAYLQVRVTSTLTGASWTTVQDSLDAETCLQVDTSATAISGGLVLYTTGVSSAKAGGSTDVLDIYLNETDIITEGTPMSLIPGNATVVGNLAVAGNITSFTNQVPTDSCGDIRTVEKTNIIDLNSTCGLTQLRDAVTTTGTGTLTGTAGQPEFVLTLTGSGDSVLLQSAERGRFVAGYTFEVCLILRSVVGAAAWGAGQYLKVGYYDGTNGFYFLVDSTGLNACTMRNGVETRTNQANFNVDKMDGTGPSGLVFGMTTGCMFKIIYGCYGYGALVFASCPVTSAGVQYLQHMHRMVPGTQTYSMYPNLPLSIYATNGTTATSRTLYIAGRQYSMIGHWLPHKRNNAAYVLNRGGVSTTFLPIISLRRKSNYLHCPVRLKGIDVLSTTDCLIQVRVATTVTGGTWTDLQDQPTTESALQCNTSATAVSGGIVIYVEMLQAGRMLNDKDQVEFDFRDNDVLTTARDEIRISTPHGAFAFATSSVRAVKLGHVVAPVRTLLKTDGSDRDTLIRHGAGRAEAKEGGEGADRRGEVHKDHPGVESGR